jgi:trans-aconitate methyltransferase
MQLHDARALISCEVLTAAPAAVQWADLGCGPGLFSHALASLLPAGSTVYAVDQKDTFDAGLSQNLSGNIVPMQYDFVRDALPFQQIDGILMANALHYVANQSALLDKLSGYMKQGASVLIVEYDTDTPVPVWVPHPLSFSSLTALFQTKGFSNIKKLQEKPSLFRRSNIYSALIQS